MDDMPLQFPGIVLFGDRTADIILLLLVNVAVGSTRHLCLSHGLASPWPLGEVRLVSGPPGVMVRVMFGIAVVQAQWRISSICLDDLTMHWLFSQLPRAAVLKKGFVEVFLLRLALGMRRPLGSKPGNGLIQVSK